MSSITNNPTPLPTTHSPVSPPIDSSTTTVDQVVSSPNDTNNNNNLDDCYTNNKYHPTSLHEKKCTNNNIYPQLWTASITNIQRYFFKTVDECCTVFYNGECEIIEDVCVDSAAATNYYHNDNGGGSGSSSSNKYYPDLISGTCYNDGKESEHQIHLFDTLEECVSFLIVFVCF